MKVPLPIVMKYGDAAAVVGRFEALREKPRRRRVKDIHRLEVGAEEQIRIAVVVVVEGDGGDRVHIAVETGGLGDVLELAVAQVLEQMLCPKRTTNRSGRPSLLKSNQSAAVEAFSASLPCGDAGLFRHIGEREVAVVVIEVILAVVHDR